ncbi:hypothetical protein RM11_0305 [Bartonella quintana RM-11]|nr:hypothetical protein RM11_0305 [Bartonella quintana RM-11]
MTVKWRGQPVVICNRTAKEIAEARTTELRILKDRQAHNPNLESAEEARDFARSASKGCENWLILINLCTHIGCLTFEQSGRLGYGCFRVVDLFTIQ